ncbi:hypothetical protein L0657_05465 [Dyadobacter sp. CY345]|uniref:hypothetical protein n=1 Tax=Dyadobacter sp. CY345 TaxID=2909335 RepID=UPI001F3511B7|nr:hypothetical protein [Dyadobacter sp. CY345]MCF2443397.1 hypothetical protein [Dyadobacter sp. CY345]
MVSLCCIRGSLGGQPYDTSQPATRLDGPGSGNGRINRRAYLSSLATRQRRNALSDANWQKDQFMAMLVGFKAAVLQNSKACVTFRFKNS